MTAGDLDALVTSILDNTRPAKPAERYLAMNAGLRAVYYAIKDVQREFFIEEGNITIPANQSRIPLTPFEKPIARIRKLVALGPTAPEPGYGTGYGEGDYGGGGYGGGGVFTGPFMRSSSLLHFRHAGQSSPEFMAAEYRVAGQNSEVLYDLIFHKGIPHLAIAPVLPTAEIVWLSTVYDPPRLTPADPTVEVEPIAERFIEVAVAYAIEWLLRAVNDADADRWGADAIQRRSAMIQTLGVTVEQHSVGVSSGLEYGDC